MYLVDQFTQAIVEMIQPILYYVVPEEEDVVDPEVMGFVWR